MLEKVGIIKGFLTLGKTYNFGEKKQESTNYADFGQPAEFSLPF